MGTRGYRIIRFRGRNWIFYNYMNSHPHEHGLGQWLVDSIPVDPRQYQKWLLCQRNFFAKWDSLLNNFLTIQVEDMRKLLSDETQKAIFSAAFDDRLKANAPPSYASAGHDGYIEWTYTIDLDHEVFSVDDSAHFTLSKVPDLWLEALFEDRESNKFLLPQLVPAESIAALVLDPPSSMSSTYYQNLQIRLVKPKNANQPSNSHLTGNRLQWMLFDIIQESWQRDLSIGLLGWQAHDLPFRELAFFILCLASGGDRLTLLDQRRTKMPYPGALYLGMTTEGSSKPDIEMTTYLGVGYHMAGLPIGSAPEETKYWFEGALICLVPRLNYPGILESAIADAVEYGRAHCTTKSFNGVLISIEHLVLIRLFPDGTVDHTEVLPLILIESHLSQDPRTRYGDRALEAFYAAHHSVKKQKVKKSHYSDRDHIEDYEEGPSTSDEECKHHTKSVASMPAKAVSIKPAFMALVQFFETITLETLPPARLNEARLPDEVCEIVLHNVCDTKTYNACLKVSRRFRLICQRRPLVMDNIVFQNFLPQDHKIVTPRPRDPPDFLAVEVSSGRKMRVWLKRGDHCTNALMCLVIAGNEWNRKTLVRQVISFQGLDSPLYDAYINCKRKPTSRHNERSERYGSEGTRWELAIQSSNINIDSNTQEIGHLWNQVLRRFDFPMNEPGPDWALPPNTIHYFGTIMGFDQNNDRLSVKVFFHYLYLCVKRLGKFCDNQWDDIIREATEQLNQTNRPDGEVNGSEEPFTILAVGLEARLFQWKQGFDENTDEEARRMRSPSSSLRELKPGTVLNVCEKSDREEIERFLKRVGEHQKIITARKSESYEGELKFYPREGMGPLMV